MNTADAAPSGAFPRMPRDFIERISQLGSVDATRALFIARKIEIQGVDCLNITTAQHRRKLGDLRRRAAALAADRGTDARLRGPFDELARSLAMVLDVIEDDTDLDDIGDWLLELEGQWRRRIWQALTAKRIPLLAYGRKVFA